eukprot:UN30196
MSNGGSCVANKPYHGSSCWEFEKSACFDNGGGIYFNNCAQASTAGNHAPVCRGTGVAECTNVYVGNSSENSRTVDVETGYVCPEYVDKGDEFQVEHVSETQIKVTRLDNPGGWGMGLEIECCTTDVGHQCQCDHGTPVVGSDCDEVNGHVCVSCDDGYELNPETRTCVVGCLNVHVGN